MTMQAPLQTRTPAARQAVARRTPALKPARAGEPRQSALAGALNSAGAVQRLTSIQARTNAAREQKKAAMTPQPKRSNAAQRVFAVGANPQNIGGLSQKVQNNWAATLQYIVALGQNVVPLIAVQVSNANDGGTNPAFTNYDAANATIDVTIQNWYLQMASTGELIGMLTHELGVHSLANAEMTGPQTVAETNTNHLATQVATGATNFPLAGQQANDARQIDHVNAVKTQMGGALRARGQRYLDTFLRMGDAIHNDLALNPGERTRRLRDLLNTFLFDIGRIVATDDGGAIRGLAGVPGATVLASRSVAEVMNWYRNTYLVPQYAAHAWLNQPALQQAATGTQVVTMLLNKLADYGAARVQTASPLTQGLLGVVGVGAAALGLAFAPVTTLALGGAGLAYGAYRYLTG